MLPGMPFRIMHDHGIRYSQPAQCGDSTIGPAGLAWRRPQRPDPGHAGVARGSPAEAVPAASARPGRRRQRSWEAVGRSRAHPCSSVLRRCSAVTKGPRSVEVFAMPRQGVQQSSGPAPRRPHCQTRTFIGRASWTAPSISSTTGQGALVTVICTECGSAWRKTAQFCTPRSSMAFASALSSQTLQCRRTSSITERAPETRDRRPVAAANPPRVPIRLRPPGAGHCVDSRADRGRAPVGNGPMPRNSRP